MSLHGAALQSYNKELVKCIEELSSNRDELHQDIIREEEKQNLEKENKLLTERLATNNEHLAKVNESIIKKMASHNEYEKNITEAEGALMKIMESSQTLLDVLRRRMRSNPVPSQ